ncbi:MAG: alkaline phosphatase family protein [Pseudomonadales bacterium]|nr:alkaline phosphatase family protein [Pseudomonadales bacterium]
MGERQNFTQLFSSLRCLQYLGSLLVALFIVTCSAPEELSPASPKAIFIIVDGIPADVLEATYTPAIDEITEAGAYTQAYVGGEANGPSQSPTVSAVGYNSLLTGTWANKHNVYDNRIENPNYQYWDIFRIAKAHDSALQTALFSTWLDNRTRLLGDGLTEAGGSKLDYYFDGFEQDLQRFPHDDASDYIKDIDDLVSDEAARFVQDQGPDLSWVYLQYTDDIGHRFGDSAELEEAVTLMDSNVGKIWDAIKSRLQTENEDWFIVVTTDHGRDLETGKSHGGQSERERLIWIATNNQNLNEHFFNYPAIVDILPSIATHLKLTIPQEISAELDGQTFIH